MRPVLSFIVPCYNVEKYIQQCLDSIYACNWSEDHYEVVCINDCSPDNVQEILERNREKHDNLRIIVHEKNKGLGGARNTGIREARGKCLWFVDSDDLVTAQGLNALVRKAVDDELDVLCFNYRRVDESGKGMSEHRVFEETSTRDGYSFVKSVFGNGIVYHMGYVVRFLYRTDYLKSHRLAFPEQVHWEDTVFMPKALLEAKRVAAVSDVLYSYRVNPDSISGVFAKAYPAKSIYEWAFCAGADLLAFSDEVKDNGFKMVFRNTAIDKYINGFVMHLFRTSRSERSRFFKMVNDHKAEIRRLKEYLNWKNKMVLMPSIGPIITNVLSFWYKKTH